MSLTPGSRLGPYEIVAPLGAGGMGEVFRARDTRLERSVAIKVLPREFADNAQLKLRFEREAKTISQLEHPHICRLYDVGESVIPSGARDPANEGDSSPSGRNDAVSYLVMELLEGETLADRLTRGPLPLPDVLKYGAQIAEALDKAHRAGVIHRDLKPGNIMITKAGAKLLDFGLAKSGAVVDMDGATQHKPLTQEGTILGTFQYMAPEQLEGEQADARTDVFAFGAVVYEMATGKRAFEGKTKTSLIAAIVKEQPRRLSEIQPLTPPTLEHVVAKCLEKDPDDRWQSAHDLAQELRWISEAGSQSGVAAPVASRRTWRQRFLVALAGLLAGVALTGAAWWWHARSPRAPIHTSVLPPHATTLLSEAGAPVLSPDGARVAFIAAKADGTQSLFIRGFNSRESTELQGTRGAMHPFWSPDGQFVAFFADGALKRIAASGGPVQTICSGTSEPRGGAWSEDGTIILSPSFRGGLFRVPAAGGTPTPLTKLTGKEQSHRWPLFLPGGKNILFLAQRGEAGSANDESALEVVSIDGRERRALTRVNSSAAFAAGYLIFWRERNLVAQRFDARKLKVRGEPVPIAENVRFTTVERAVFDVSGNGTLLYEAGTGADVAEVVWVDRSGKRLSVVGARGAYGGLVMSRDERMLATSLIGQSEDVWLFDLERGTQTRFTFDPVSEATPIWSPDGSRLVYARVTDLMEKTMGGEVRTLIKSSNPLWPSDWSSDARYVLLDLVTPATKTDLAVYSFEDGRLRVIAQTPFDEYSAKFSPDGRWITYSSNESGWPEVFVRAIAGSGLFQISTNGGGWPRWSRKGDEIFYVASNGDMMAVPVDMSNGFRAGIPQRLFRVEMGNPRGDTMYDVSSDGQRFLIGARIESKETASFQVVQNWTGLLRR